MPASGQPAFRRFRFSTDGDFSKAWGILDTLRFRKGPGGHIGKRWIRVAIEDVDRVVKAFNRAKISYLSDQTDLFVDEHAIFQEMRQK